MIMTLQHQTCTILPKPQSMKRGYTRSPAYLGFLVLDVLVFVFVLANKSIGRDRVQANNRLVCSY